MKGVEVNNAEVSPRTRPSCRPSLSYGPCVRMQVKRLRPAGGTVICDLFFHPRSLSCLYLLIEKYIGFDPAEDKDDMTCTGCVPAASPRKLDLGEAFQISGRSFENPQS